MKSEVWWIMDEWFDACLVFSLDLFIFYFFFFNDTATTEIYTLSLHDALPILDTWCLVAAAQLLVNCNRYNLIGSE